MDSAIGISRASVCVMAVTSPTRGQIEEAMLKLIETALEGLSGASREVAAQRLDALWEGAQRAARRRLVDEFHEAWREDSLRRDEEHG